MMLQTSLAGSKEEERGVEHASLAVRLQSRCLCTWWEVGAEGLPIVSLQHFSLFTSKRLSLACR